MANAAPATPSPETPREPAPDRGRSGWRTMRPGLVLVLVGTGLLLWLVGRVLLLVFAGILLATALDALSTLLCRWTRLNHGWSLLVVLLMSVLLIVLFGIAVAPELAGQFDELWTQLNTIVAQLQSTLRRYGWARQLLGDDQQMSDTARQVAGQIASVTMTAIGMLSNLLVIAVIGIYIAVNPGLYRHGAVRLVPPRHRERAREALATMAHVLRWWLLGQLVSMVVLGVTTSLVLLLLGIPLWLPLGVLTGVVNFIPFLGPIIAAVPILLISLGQGIETALYVLLAYTIVQSIEGYWLMPMVQQRAIRLPPALLIAMQVLLGSLFGLWGLGLAAPLTAAAMVAVNLLYIEGVLGERSGGS